LSLDLLVDEGPSRRTHIRSLTKAMDRRMEEQEEGVQNTLFLWRINF